MRTIASTRAEAAATAVIYPYQVTFPAPAIAQFAGGAGKLLTQIRPALAGIPWAGMSATFVAAADNLILGVGVVIRFAIAGLRWSVAAVDVVSGGKYGPTAVVDPDKAIATAPGATFDTGGAGKVLQQYHGAAERYAALAEAMIIAGAGDAGAAFVPIMSLCKAWRWQQGQGHAAENGKGGSKQAAEVVCVAQHRYPHRRVTVRRLSEVLAELAMR